MIQITFQPALDPLHAVFRLFRLRRTIDQFGPLHKDHVSILDFYLLFPFRIGEIRLYPKHRSYKKLGAAYAGVKPYGELPDSNVLFNRMQPIGRAAMETMAEGTIFDINALQRGMIENSVQATPVAIETRVTELNAAQQDLLTFLGVLASAYNVFGDDGLKDRTGLIEFRYDAI